MKNWEEELKHYHKNRIDDIKDEDLLDEAIATCENIFGLMEEDKLHHHSRPLAMAYLALKYMKRRTETTFTKEALEKQIEKEAIPNGENDPYYHCPVCGEYELELGCENYCPRCGQKLKYKE
jgi:rubrerythrin